ncbi:MAG: anhydro-N-acetylmuramic acid kinase, partial [Symploca sp. SIO2B6]|nr:anhydro-N-acetylmuramic acid kinase [Symploca sp. SIO2B6]
MRVIGLISGTSVDGVDTALMEVSGTTTDLTIELLASQTVPYPEDLRQRILAVCGGAALSMAELAQLDDAIALTFAHAAQTVQIGQPAADLIGSHGQTVYHNPPSLSGQSGFDPSPQPTSSAVLKSKIPSVAIPDRAITTSQIPLGYSLQIGRGALIAAQTGIPTISNFRAADIAMGGHGAPLVPPVDRHLLGHPTLNRCVQNIGGIGNLAYLPARSPTFSPSSPSLPATIYGWDTGPGNALLDLAVQTLSQGELTYDQDSQWDAQGNICQSLVEQWMQHPYFHQAPPKSTGRELFGED